MMGIEEKKEQTDPMRIEKKMQPEKIAPPIVQDISPHENDRVATDDETPPKAPDSPEAPKNPQHPPPAPRTVIALKRIIKQQHVWGFNEEYVFKKLDPPDLLEKCPSCGAGPIKWSAIRNKRNNNSVSRLRCNRQAKGTCDYRGALRRTERKRMQRAAANANKTRLSQPIDQAYTMLKDAVRLLQNSDKTTLFTYISRNEIPMNIRSFMMQFLAENSGEPLPLPLPEQPFFLGSESFESDNSRFLGAAPIVPQPSLSAILKPTQPPMVSTNLPSQTPAPSSTFAQQPPALASALPQQRNMLAPNSHQENQSSSMWGFGVPSTDPLSAFGSGRIGRFSASMGLEGMGAQVNPSSRVTSAAMPDVASNMSLGPGWNTSLDFKPLSLNTGTSHSHASLSNGMSVLPQREDSNSLSQLALEASRTTTPNPRNHNRKRELAEKHVDLPSKKAGYHESALDPPRTLPKSTTEPPVAVRTESIQTMAINPSSTFGQINPNVAGVTQMRICPCCLNSVSPNERFCVVCGACLQWT